MNRSRSISHASGFTLVEVLAALVLIGVILPVAMSGISMSLQATDRARRAGEATSLARQQLAAIVLQNDTSQLTGSGDFGNTWQGYRWESRFASREYGVYEITVDVFYVQNGVERSSAVSTLMYPSTAASSTSTTGATQ